MMDKNEILQLTAVGIIVLLALLWAAWKVLKMGKGRNSGCSCCSESDECKLKDLKQNMKAKTPPENCRDGRSARN